MFTVSHRRRWLRAKRNIDPRKIIPVQHRNNHWLAWLMIAGIILAGLTLSAVAQYPNSPSYNGTGVMPMAPATLPSMPQYGIVPKPPYEPTTTTRPANWVGGTAPNPTPNNNPLPEQNTSPGQYPQTDSYPQTNAPPQSQQQWNAPAGAPNLSPDYPSTGPNTFPPPMNAPGNSPAGFYGGINPNPARSETLNITGSPQLNPSTETLARVGSEGIFASEITPQVDRYLADFKSKMSPEEFELHRSEFDAQRELLIKRSLKSHIESKLIFQDVKRDLPAEGLVNVNKQLSNLFEKSELPKLMKREGVTTIKELEQKLNAFNSSISQEKKAYIEKALVGEWVRRQIKTDEEPTVTQMTSYYNAHKADFTTPAKARWEEITVNKAKYANKDEAFAAIAQLGNQVLAGAPFAEIAKQSSDGFTAPKGGLRDWVAKGSLADKEIDKAVFGLPVGALSPIIETPQDYNIIRVVERVEQKTEDFLVAQDNIRKKIHEERTDRLFREYLDRLEKRTPIWTIYDGTGDNLRLAERLNEKQR